MRARGDDAGAERVLTRFLSRQPTDPGARAALAALRGEEAAPAAPDARSPEDRLRRARDLYEASGENPDGLEEAESLVASVLAASDRADALALGGRIAFRQRRYPEAAERLVRALDADPRDVEAWALALRALARSADPRAERVADDALLLLASDASVAAGAAEVLLAADRPADALKAAPDSPDGHALRAMALAALGRAEEAADALGDARGADPVLLSAAEGDLALARGDASGARAAWGRALALDPNNAWLRARE